MEAFLAEVTTKEWNHRQDGGRPWAEAVAELCVGPPREARPDRGVRHPLGGDARRPDRPGRSRSSPSCGTPASPSTRSRTGPPRRSRGRARSTTSSAGSTAPSSRARSGSRSLIRASTSTCSRRSRSRPATCSSPTTSSRTSRRHRRSGSRPPSSTAPSRCVATSSPPASSPSRRHGESRRLRPRRCAGRLGPALPAARRHARPRATRWRSLLRDVLNRDWNLARDAGDSWPDAMAALAAQYPEHVEIFRAYDERWGETLGGDHPETVAVLAELRDCRDAAVRADQLVGREVPARRGALPVARLVRRHRRVRPDRHGEAGRGDLPPPARDVRADRVRDVLHRRPRAERHRGTIGRHRRTPVHRRRDARESSSSRAATWPI